ncbi:MAG: hypothetical protein RJP95_01920 [Pirellulales bacterium]
MTREEQIDTWLDGRWSVSKKGTGAQYRNLRGWHVAVWEDRNHPGEWTWHMAREGQSDGYRYSKKRFSSERAAKRDVLNTLAEELAL